MKTFVKSILFVAALGLATPAFAQHKHDTLKVNPDPKIKRAAKKVGNKTAEIASKGASKVVDKTYADKTGPNGQTIYIDKNSSYYYVNKKGKRIYVAESQLKAKP